MTELTAWILRLMLSLTVGASPFAPTYEDTAKAIAIASASTPAFGGALGPKESAAILVAIAWRESRFDPAALGDCTTGVPRSLATCRSLGLFQINRSHGREFDLLSPPTAAFIAARLVRTSNRICASLPPLDRLGWYAAGGEGCRGLAASRNRMRLAAQLLQLE